MADLEQFRTDTREWLEEECAGEMLDAAQDAGRAVLGRPEGRLPRPRHAVAGGHGGARLDGADVAEGVRRRRALEAGGQGPRRGDGEAAPPPAAHRLRPLDDRAAARCRRAATSSARSTCRPIIRGEIRWCQGYSEPGSGSDLASLQTKAVRDGDVYVLNGQKVWTSYADKADWMFILVRTDFEAPKHNGITFLLMDMTSPGVSVKPIKLISGYSPFCETFLSDVRVPVKNVVGQVNAGLDDGEGAPRPRAHDDRRRVQRARRRAEADRSGAKRHLGEEDGKIADRAHPRPHDAGRDGSGLPRPHARALARQHEGGAQARARDVDLQVLRHRAQHAPARADGRHLRPAGRSAGKGPASTRTSSR